MKTNKQIMNFDALKAEMDVLSGNDLMSITGGLNYDELILYAYAQDWEGGGIGQGEVTSYLSNFFGQSVSSSIDSAGNWTISIGGAPAIPLTFQLDEVVITATSGPRFGVTVIDYNIGLQNWGSFYGNSIGDTPYYSWQHPSGGDTAMPTPQEMKLLGINAMRGYLGTEYSMGNDNLTIMRTGTDSAALDKMDCSELVSRYLHAIGMTQQIEPYDTTQLKAFFAGNGAFSYHTEGPQVGDIFIWRYNGSGHTGIVTAVDPVTGRVTTLEAISESADNSHSETYHSVIETSYDPDSWHLEGHAGWGGQTGNGYYTPNVGI